MLFDVLLSKKVNKKCLVEPMTWMNDFINFYSLYIYIKITKTNINVSSIDIFVSNVYLVSKFGTQICLFQ